MDRRGQTLGQQLEYVVVLGQFLALGQIFAGNVRVAVLVQLRNVVCNDDRTKRPGGVATLLPRQTAIVPNDLHSVARFALIDQIVVAYNVNGARQLAGRRLLWHLLNRQCLMILVHR